MSDILNQFIPIFLSPLGFLFYFFLFMGVGYFVKKSHLRDLVAVWRP